MFIYKSLLSKEPFVDKKFLSKMFPEGGHQTETNFRSILDNFRLVPSGGGGEGHDTLAPRFAFMVSMAMYICISIYYV